MEETEAKREKTQRALDCTRTVLHKTEGERAEQVRLRAERVRPEGPREQAFSFFVRKIKEKYVLLRLVIYAW